MKLFLVTILMAASLALTACSFTLAADITPPPDYVSPTPMPTLGALYPASAPDSQNGAAIYAQNCAACHGDKGLGDGPQSMQLPVSVPAVGLPEVARSASPADWYKMVTQGNLDRFMPPFAGTLSDQERWDVVAYMLTLHTTSEEVARGKSLVQSRCSDCSSKFANQTKMAALSESDLVTVIRNGAGDIPAIGKDLTDEDANAAAVYLRSLSFAPQGQIAAAATPSPAGTQISAPLVASTTPVPTSGGTPITTPGAAAGTITGSVVIPTGGQVANLTITLHGFDHAQDQTTGPQEVLTLTTTAAADGSYVFDNLSMPANRLFRTEATYDGIQYRSDYAAAAANATNVAVPPLKLYAASTDVNLLKLDQVHIYTDFATAGTVQVLEIFAFSNTSSNAVIISTDGTTIPFIRLPAGAQNPGYEAGQDSAPFVAADKGLAVPPNDKPYSIIAFFNLPYNQKLQVDQPMVIDTSSILLLVPDGMKVEGKQLASRGLQAIQSNNYQEFSTTSFKAGETLSFSVSGQAKASSSVGIDAHQGILVGAGILGIVFIIGGVLLYLRDRRREAAGPPESEFDSADEVMDAMLALDDLHRAGKISEDAYRIRREELKESLREIA